MDSDLHNPGQNGLRRMELTIDLWADVVCPWCYIGERRLLRALREVGAEAVVRWRPYQLDPTLPPEGVPWSDYVQRKFGGLERARPMFAHVAAAAAQEGIDLDFGRMQRSPNTVDAHRLILLAEREGDGLEVAEAVYRAHFTEGRDVGDRQVLEEIGGEAGLLGVRETLAGDAFRSEIRDAAAEARRIGIQGVPFFVFEGRLAVSGAQRVEVFRQALEEARAA